MSAENEEKWSETHDIDEKVHPFDALMFGAKTPKPPPKEEKSDTEGTLFNQVNVDELMVQMNILMESAKQLKPVFYKIRPFIEQFIKK